VSTYGSEAGVVLQNAVNKRSFAEVREEAGIDSKRVAAAKRVIIENASQAFGQFGKRGSLVKDQAVAKRATLTSLCSEETVQQNLGRATARLLNTRRSNVKLGAERRTAALIDEGLWALIARNTRSDKLSVENKARVVRFWTEKTRVSLNQKDVRRQWIASKVFREHITHLLEMPQVRAVTSIPSFTGFDSVRCFMYSICVDWGGVTIGLCNMAESRYRRPVQV
jgi:hypothetical protein